MIIHTYGRFNSNLQLQLHNLLQLKSNGQKRVIIEEIVDERPTYYVLCLLNTHFLSVRPTLMGSAQYYPTY